MMLDIVVDLFFVTAVLICGVQLYRIGYAKGSEEGHSKGCDTTMKTLYGTGLIYPEQDPVHPEITIKIHGVEGEFFVSPGNISEAFIKAGGVVADRIAKEKAHSTSQGG